MNVLTILKSDLYSLFEQLAAHRVAKAPSFEKKATVCKYLVPEGYPGNSDVNQPLTIDSAAIEKSGARMYYASVAERNGIIHTQSSRTIGLVGIANTIGEAEKIAESACNAITGKVWHRNDIGTPALVQRRISHMKQLGAL
jgi:phosphoribosylamine--glycine ligase